MTGILTAINATDIHMIWGKDLSRILKLSTEVLFIIRLGNSLHVYIPKYLNVLFLNFGFDLSFTILF